MQVFAISPRGFCAGVRRAIEILEGVIVKYGKEKKIFVKNQIVHNEYVVEYFQNKGITFVNDINEVEANSVIVFSAHGVSDDVEKKSSEMGLTIIDATCPLVQKVHRSIKKHDDFGRVIILIGHKNHPEVEGTSGRVQGSKVIIVENVNDIDLIDVDNKIEYAYTTQTTLSIDDTADIVKALKEKIPHVISQDESNICYATQNRQNAVKEVIKDSDLLIVLGSKKSSNSARLMEIGLKNGIPSYMVNSVAEVDKKWFEGKGRVCLTSGASSPEVLFQDMISFLQNQLDATIVERVIKDEFVEFHTPKNLRVGDVVLF